MLKLTQLPIKSIAGMFPKVKNIIGTFVKIYTSSDYVWNKMFTKKFIV